MSFDVDALVELDRLNMTAVIERAGGKFDPQFRRSKLLVEQERGAEFVCVGRHGRTVAYLEYLCEPDGAWQVLSIQIHPAHQTGFVLRDLLNEAGGRLLAKNPVAIRSSVHVTNHASLRLHRKLGFIETDRTADRVLFRIDGGRLSQRLVHFHEKNTMTNNPVERTQLAAPPVVK
jgi:L-amino acid N-acyltransferase YncA